MRGATLSSGDLLIRPLLDTPAEYARLAQWRNQPHVREWWEPDLPPMTVDNAIAEYRDDAVGRTATRPAIIEVADVPVGFVQYYPWAAYQDELDSLGLEVAAGSWGLDIYIGDPLWMGRGVGSRAVRLLCDHLFDAEGATAVAFGVEVDNLRAQHAYQKAGMVPTTAYLDSDTRGGERVQSILLVREPMASPEPSRERCPR